MYIFYMFGTRDKTFDITLGEYAQHFHIFIIIVLVLDYQDLSMSLMDTPPLPRFMARVRIVHPSLWHLVFPSIGSSHCQVKM